MPYQQVTLAELQQQLKDRWESAPFWADAAATTYINESLRWWNAFTGFWKARKLIATVAATTSNFPTGYLYSLSGVLTFASRVMYDQSPMDISSIYDLNYGRPNWRGEITTAGGVIPTKPKLWAPVGLQSFVIWPGDAVGGHSLLVDGVMATPVLSAAGDFVNLGQEDLHVLLGEALHIAAFKPGGAILAATLPMHREFIVAAGEKNSRFRASAYFRRAMGEDRQRWQKPAELAPRESPQEGRG